MTQLIAIRCWELMILEQSTEVLTELLMSVHPERGGGKIFVSRARGKTKKTLNFTYQLSCVCQTAKKPATTIKRRM